MPNRSRSRGKLPTASTSNSRYALKLVLLRRSYVCLDAHYSLYDARSNSEHGTNIECSVLRKRLRLEKVSSILASI